MTRAAIVLLLLVAVVAACGSDPVPPSTTADPIALSAPLREARTIPQPDGSIRIEAVSAPVMPDQPYFYPAFTHCGFTANTFDFKGSFWAISDAPAGFAAEAIGANPPPGIDNPVDRGVIVLVGADQAIWTSRAGARLQLARGPSDVRVFGCD